MTPQDWKNLALFLIVAVPGLMILTHLVAWIAGRIKGRPAPAPDPAPKAGYDSVEEFRKDAEELSVGDLLDRCAGLGAPENAALEERKTKAKEAARAEADPATPDVKPGRWYRRSDGSLVVLLGLDCREGFGRFLEWGDFPPVELPLSTVGPVVPMPGEWWIRRACPKHAGRVDSEPIRVEDLACLVHPSVAVERVDCGCLAPANFGKGPIRKTNIDWAMQGGVGSRPDRNTYQPGYPSYGPAGMMGPYPIHPQGGPVGMMGPRKCGDCLGNGMRGFGNGVPERCMTCKGSGLTA